MKRYSYSGNNIQEILKWQFAGSVGSLGILLITFVNIISIFLVPLSPYPETTWGNMRFSLLCWSLLFLLIGFSIASFFINYFPTIWIDDDGVYISYFFYKLKIPWKQLRSIKTVRAYPKIVLVQARKITPWHIHYSAYYSFSFKPGFLIRGSIDNFDELTQTITRNIQTNK